MSKYPQWDKTHQGFPMIWQMNGFRRRANANAYYAPGVDRFFAVDGGDPYTAYDVAQVLSSKVPGICVCVLHIVDPYFTHEDCHEYTLKNKNVYAAGASILFSKQIPAFRKMQGIDGQAEVIKVPDGKMPVDWQSEEMQTAFRDLQEYAKFAIFAMHAIKICDMHFNFMPMETYATSFLTGMVPESITTITADNVHGGNIQTGLSKELKKIVYLSQTVDEALERIENMWLNNNTPHSVNWKALFYKIMELEMPDKLKTVELDLSQYSAYLL